MRERGIKGWSFAKSLNEFMVKNATRTTTLVIPRVFGLRLQTNNNNSRIPRVFGPSAAVNNNISNS